MQIHYDPNVSRSSFYLTRFLATLPSPLSLSEKRELNPRMDPLFEKVGLRRRERDEWLDARFDFWLGRHRPGFRAAFRLGTSWAIELGLIPDEEDRIEKVQLLSSALPFVGSHHERDFWSRTVVAAASLERELGTGPMTAIDMTTDDPFFERLPEDLSETLVVAAPGLCPRSEKCCQLIPSLIERGWPLRYEPDSGTTWLLPPPQLSEHGPALHHECPCLLGQLFDVDGRQGRLTDVEELELRQRAWPARSEDELVERFGPPDQRLGGFDAADVREWFLPTVVEHLVWWDLHPRVVVIARLHEDGFILLGQAGKELSS
ncbi:MAG: hypothetical protein AAF533_03115 [Acidobacteriota bacterium]